MGINSTHDQLRKHVIKQLGRKVKASEKTKELEIELLNSRIQQLEKIRDGAFRFMAQRSAKDNAMFHKGLMQGYSAFIDEDGEFCGDRGRTEIYAELLSSSHQIEKMRRMLPAKNDADLYDHLSPWYRFPQSRKVGIEWLRDVCDDISLYMTGKRGRPFGPRRATVF
jgi:hypothetical protein